MHRIIPLLIVVLTSSALAVGTSHWTHTTEADFKAGKFDNVVATNLGDLKLSRNVRTIVHQDARVSAVYALAEGADGAIYAATGPQGVLLRVNGDKVETAAVLGDNVNLFAVLVDAQGNLLVGTGGEHGQIFRVDPRKPDQKPTEIFSAAGVQYVWALRQTPDGNLYAATGPNGQLFEIHPDGSNKVLFDTEENNLLSLVSDGKDLLYVGTDPNGHVYRVNRKSGESFVVFDAPETEVSALAIDARGNVFAGTGQSTGAEGDVDTSGAAEKTGRPEVDQDQPRVAPPIPGEPPKSPEPPKLPLPGPGDPPAIPRAAVRSEMPIADRRLPIGGVPNRQSAVGNRQSDPLYLQAAPGEPDPEPNPNPRPGPGRKPGPNQPPGADATKQAQGDAPRIHAVASQKAGQPPAEGNAVYRIDPQGFVTEIFRGPVLVLSIYENNGVLLVATGSENGGMVYQINPAAEETSVVTKIDPQQVLSLLPAKDGRVYMGTANEGQIASMSSGYATSGTFTSSVLDAQQISRPGKIHLRGLLPEKTKLTIATRSGNVAETSDSGWSKWSDEAPATEYVEVASPAARFYQYRLSFHASDAGSETPVVDEVDVAYQVPNQTPSVKSIKVTTGGAGASVAAELSSDSKGPGGTGTVSISWEASDPNNDQLRYTLYYRRDSTGPWILLKDKLVEASFDWNTRSVGDGRYQVKVVASDALANPMGEGRSSARVSDSVLVDNTPPVIGDVSAQPRGAGGATVKLKAVDRTSTIALLEYAIDGSGDWQSVLPVDKIADSPEEAYELTLGGLTPGPHQVTVRATDAHGNQAFESVNVTVEKP